MVKCNESLLSPREKRSIVRGVKNKHKDKNLTDEDMKTLVDEAMAHAVKTRSPRRVYSVVQAKPYQRRRVPGSVVRATELECAEDFIPLSTSEHLKAFLEEEEHCSAFEVETSSESRTSTSEACDSEDKVTTSEAGDSEDKVTTSEAGDSEGDGSEDKVTTSEGDDSDKEQMGAEASSETSSVGCIQESDSDSYDDLDDDVSIIGHARRFCCGRR